MGDTTVLGGQPVTGKIDFGFTNFPVTTFPWKRHCTFFKMIFMVCYMQPWFCLSLICTFIVKNTVWMLNEGVENQDNERIIYYHQRGGLWSNLSRSSTTKLSLHKQTHSSTDFQALFAFSGTIYSLRGSCGFGLEPKTARLKALQLAFMSPLANIASPENPGAFPSQEIYNCVYYYYFHK